MAMGLKFYDTEGSPPCVSVKLAFKYLNLKPEVTVLDLATKHEQLEEKFLKINPIGELPCLVDDGVLISESVAILQYIADKYKKDETFYPTDLKKRAVINQRLAFYISTYYKAILDYWIFPTFLGAPTSDFNSKRLARAVDVFNRTLTDSDIYVVGSNLTIADLPFIMGTACLETIEFDLKPYPKVDAYYKRFQKNQPELWKIVNEQGLTKFKEYVKNPPPQSTFKA